jgi:two-component system sensor histidine kinase HydH
MPILLTRTHPGSALTRHVIAASQMLWSALLIHLTGGRIETHFHVFGSLAFVAFYRDYRPLVTATLVVAADHFIRGLLFPESVYGIVNPEWWRFLEHAGWVALEDAILVLACLRGVREMREIAGERAELEAISAREERKSAALDEALRELQRSQDALVRQEKLAAIGELAASVGHELRNPLTAIANAGAYVTKKLSRAPHEDPRVAQFLGVIAEEVTACGKIIADLLDFAREKPLALAACPLAPLVDDAVALVPRSAGVTVTNDVPRDLPIPTLDKDKFRQIIINLVSNAVEAIPAGRTGEVVISAEGGGEHPWALRIADNGVGISDEVAGKVFQPLFTTKSKGTGLGLAIVATMIQRHKGSIRVDSEVGRGSTFIIQLPAVPADA